VNKLKETMCSASAVNKQYHSRMQMYKEHVWKISVCIWGTYTLEPALSITRMRQFVTNMVKYPHRTLSLDIC